MKIAYSTLAPIVLLITAMALIIILWLSIGINAETDSITHFQFARYAFKYPEFFLNHWGKPLFTILASPFSQFGYFGAVVFNLLCGLLSAWFVYLIAKTLEYRHAWVAIVFTIFTPVYLFIMYTSLTEILFSLVLIAAIYMFASQRFIWSAVIISFIPFARTEGMMFIVLFIPALLWMKQFKTLPFLLAGFIIFSLIGWPQYHDLFWFFTKMPYSNAGSELYGSGSFWYYFKELDYIMNFPLLILSVTGLIYLLIKLKSNFKNRSNIKFVVLYILIVPSFFGFIIAQSFLWWQGLMGVLGSTRFIACVLPLGSLIALTGFEWIMEKANQNRIIYWVLGIFVLVLVIRKPFTYNQLPMHSSMNFAVMEELTNWLKKSPFNTRKAFYTDPMFPFYNGTDPFDQQKCFKIYNYENIDPASLLQPGEILIWDAQFACFEGHLPFDSLMNNDNMKLLSIFTPKESFTVIGGENYKLAVFMKAPRDTTKKSYQQFYFNNFESNISADQLTHITTEEFKSGKQAIILKAGFNFSPAVEDRLLSLPGKGRISLKASASIMIPSSDEKDEVLLVVGVDDEKQKVYKYNVSKSTETKYKPGEWFELTFTDVVDRYTPVNGTYKAYVWYTGTNEVFVDDLKLEWMPVGYE